uniref:hypothetical protein n=1 Tax=Ndongobacter massiliensis TaxID=1871025 RepID=UPI0009F80F1C|nr:hypothetical protein [Ndongobacter massiliensis]
MVDDLIKVNVNTEAFEKGFALVSKQLIELVALRVRTAGEYLKGQAVEEAPSDTGALRAAMFTDTECSDEAIVAHVGNRQGYATYVHQGTGRYAKDGDGRKKPWRVETVYKGKPVIFWTVGQKPNPFLERATQKNIGSIKKILGVR